MSDIQIVTANRNHKDRLFCYIFGHEENKKYLLSLYNALNGSHYQNPEELEFTTLEDAIYMSMKNDVSFLISDYMNLFEHQSTINPNMPLRGFFYFARLYEAYLSRNRYSIYSHTLIPLPTPQYFVFFNGKEEVPERQTYRLSDAFLKKVNSHQFEWTATMLNINAGHNPELMKHCAALSEYADFIQDVRSCQAVYHDLNQAVDEAVKQAALRPCLGNFFRKNRAEVSHLVLTEFDEEAFQTTMREEGRVEGLKEGRVEGLKEGRVEGLKEGRVKGLKEGEEKTLIQLVCKKMLKNKQIPEIADALEADVDHISKIYSIAKEQLPDYDVDAIYAQLNIVRH